MTEPAMTADAQEGISGRPPAEQALHRLLHGQRGPHDEQLLGMPVLGTRVVVIEFDVDAPPGGRTLPPASGRGAVGIEMSSRESVVLVRHTPHSAEEDRGLVAARRYADHVCRLGGHVRAGISAAIHSLDDVAPAYADARDAARLATGGSALEVDRVWADVVLARLGDRLPDLLTMGNPLARLSAHDARTGGDLCGSVAAWLRADRDTSLAAEALHVHPNTVRYRLRRAETTSGLDLADGAQRLAVELIDRCLRP